MCAYVRTCGQAHVRGSALLTIATADEKTMDPTWEQKLGLVAGHAYAVLDMKEALVLPSSSLIPLSTHASRSVSSRGTKPDLSE